MQSPYPRPHMADHISTVVIVLTQTLIGVFLWKDFRPRVSKPVFRAVATVVVLLWVIVAGAVWLNMLDEAYRRDSFPSALCSLWMAVANLWAIPAAAAVFAYLIYRYVASRPQVARAVEHNPQRRTMLRAAGTAAVAAPFVATGFGALVERTNFQVREVDFPIRNLHPDMEGFRIVQVSDLHVSPYLSVREAGRAIDIANELKPHLAVVTGDLISEYGDPLDGAIAQIARLRADTGVLGCLGNHEIYAECEDYATAESARRGVKFLRGESRVVRWGSGSLNVAGVDYQTFFWKNGRYLRGAEKLVAPGMPNLLLSHNPDVFPVAVDKG